MLLEQVSEIFSKMKLIDLTLFLEKEKILIIADLHLGFEEALIESGTFIPKFNFEDIKLKLKKVFRETGKLNKIIIVGDFKHEFGKISQQEWKELIKMIDFLQENCKQLVLIGGNHDKILKPIANIKKIKIEKKGITLRKGEIFVLHGDKIIENTKSKKAKLLLIGHEHPAISLKDNNRVEKFKCFLKGKWLDKKIIVLPSMISITIGTDVLREKLLSPYLQQDLSDFEVWIVEDKAYYFGKIKNLLEEKNEESVN